MSLQPKVVDYRTFFVNVSTIKIDICVLKDNLKLKTYNSKTQETAIKLFEAIERPLRGDDNYDKPYDLSLEQTAMVVQVS